MKRYQKICLKGLCVAILIGGVAAFLVLGKQGYTKAGLGALAAAGVFLWGVGLCTTPTLTTSEIIVAASEMHDRLPKETTLIMACENLMHRIDCATKEGRSQMLFDPIPADLYDAVKTEFAAKGYLFVPVDENRVAQPGNEYICW